MIPSPPLLRGQRSRPAQPGGTDMTKEAKHRREINKRWYTHASARSASVKLHCWRPTVLMPAPRHTHRTCMLRTAVTTVMVFYRGRGRRCRSSGGHTPLHSHSGGWGGLGGGWCCSRCTASAGTLETVPAGSQRSRAATSTTASSSQQEVAPISPFGNVSVTQQFEFSGDLTL